jgi:hypothetical protein
MPQQMSQAIYTFKQLYAACEDRGLHARLHVFDCGETIYVYDGATLVVRITAECGDTFVAADRAARWLLEHKWLSAQDMKRASADA